MRRADPGHIRFADDTQVAYDRPRDTRDPRYAACRDHRPACDCREAEISEELAEQRGEDQLLRRTLGQLLAGHTVETCMCTGCQIARVMGLTFVVHTENLAARMKELRA